MYQSTSIKHIEHAHPASQEKSDCRRNLIPPLMSVFHRKSPTSDKRAPESHLNGAVVVVVLVPAR
jgi:hypothetical protein